MFTEPSHGMLDRVISWSLRNRLVALLGAVVLLAGGAYSALTIPVDVFPDLTAPTVTVITEAHGMAPEEVETLVTFPIETAVNGASGVRRVRSASAQGIGIVWVEFDWGTEIFRARQVVGEKLQLLAGQLPADVGPPVLAPITSIMGEILLVGLTSDRHSEMDLRGVADWTVRKRLLAVPGVAQVVPTGGQVKEYQVLVHPERLAFFKLSLNDVLEAARNSNSVASGGVYLDSGQEILVRGLSRARTVEDIGATVVAVNDGAPILLSDLSEIRIGPQPRFGTASVNTQEAVILTVQKQPKANTLELIERIDLELDRIQAQLPEGMEINRHLFRQSDFISVAISNVVNALRDGAFLVVIILFLFLWNFRTTVISVLAIPLSLAVVLVFMKLIDASINTMTLGGMAIAIGALVDDAIIFVENAFRRLRENRARPPTEQRLPAAVIYGAAREIRGPIVNATLIISIVFVPFFFLSGVEGRMLQPLGFAYIVSILGSLLVALTVTPALCYYLLKDAPAIERGESWLVRRLTDWYQTILAVALDRPTWVMVPSAALFLTTLAILPFLGSGFLPEFQEGTLTLSAVSVPGTGIEESDKIGDLIEEKLLAHPAVVSTARRTGRAELDEHAQGVNSAEIDALLDLSVQDQETVTEELRRSLALVPGTNITIGQPLGHRIDHMLSGTRASIAIKLFGPDLHELRRVAEQIRKAAEDVPGLVDLAVEQQADVPQLRIVPDRVAMAKYGVTPHAVAEVIDIGFNGEAVSQILEEQRTFDLVVRFDDRSRGSLEKVMSAMMDTPLGGQVPLTEVADIRQERGPNLISRENVQRKIVIQANVAGRDVGTVVEEIRAKVDGQVVLPDGYWFEFGGQFESGQAATRAIGLLSLLSILAIFLILFQEFQSTRTSVLIMVNLPLSLIGGVFAVMVAAGGVLNVATLVGFITLFGIAVRNGILLVTRYETLLAEGFSLKEAITQGSLERLSPILMTALTAGLALIPLALGGGEPGKEIQSPMALVVLGGLLSSTFLNMVVVPVLFHRYGGKGTKNSDPEGYQTASA
jgi:CzcA family heavy metal efflux pump